MRRILGSSMLARLLNLLVPSVRLERERDLARQAVDELSVRILLIEHQRDRALEERVALQRRFDRLVEARLIKDGAISTLLSDPPASKPTSAPSFFANLARVIDRRDAPDGEDDLDSIPAGGTMLP